MDDPTEPTDRATAAVGSDSSDDDAEVTEVEEHPRPPRRSTSGGTVMGAAMLGLGEVLEPNKTKVEIEQVATDDERDDDLPFRLEFGELPGLD